MIEVFFIISIWAVVLVVSFVFLAATINPFGCFVFFHSEFKLWERIIERADECNFLEETVLGYYFTVPSDIFNDTTKEYVAILWKDDNSVSIHFAEEYRCSNSCVLCSYDKLHSDRMGKILRSKLNERKAEV